MYRMSVTLDVSKLSGWLNADAYCRVETWACGVGKRCGRREGRGFSLCQSSFDFAQDEFGAGYAPSVSAAFSAK